MIVVLPCGTERAVPEGCRSGAELKRQIEARERIPCAVQRLLFAGALVEDDRSFASQSIPASARLDLTIEIGERWTLCRDALRDRFPGRETLVPAPSGSRARSAEALHPETVRFYGLNPLFHGRKPQQDRLRAVAEPYYDAYRRCAGERLERLAEIRAGLEQGPLLVTTFNEGFSDLFRNWEASCRAHAIDPRGFSIVFPMDEAADALARRMGFETYYDGVCYGKLPRNSVSVYGNDDYARCMFIKTAIVQDALQLDSDVLFQDIDVVWRRDPRSYLSLRARQEDLDFQFMYDGPNARFQPLHFNTGFFFVSSNALSRCAWSVVFEHLVEAFDFRSQQAVVNIVMSCLRERGLRAERLSETCFVNGHATPIGPEGPAALAPDLFVVHASWTHNLAFKLEKLRSYGLWYLD